MKARTASPNKRCEECDHPLTLLKKRFCSNACGRRWWLKEYKRLGYPGHSEPFTKIAPAPKQAVNRVVAWPELFDDHGVLCKPKGHASARKKAK
jgi:hypothetical protein